MVPLDEYVTVSEDATLYEAVMALEKAHEDLDRSRYLYLHRAVLVYDEDKKIIGKISQLDALRALEPRYAEMGDSEKVYLAGFSPQFLKSMMEQFTLWSDPLIDICKKAAKRKVSSFMHTPTKGEYIDIEGTLQEACHLLVMGHHQSLLVTKNSEIVGILRMTDVFKEVFRLMRLCEI